MAERFVSLAMLLCPPPEAPAQKETPSETLVSGESLDVTGPVLADVMTFRARLAEAFEGMRERLLTELATEVLARELQLAPVAIEAIARRLVTAFADEEPLALRVSPSDHGAVRIDIPVEADAQLRRGDAVLVVRDGELESTLGIRLDAILRSAAR
jgi:flagellar biosynthesis/type III secretory pathway protein FliH